MLTRRARYVEIMKRFTAILDQNKQALVSVRTHPDNM
jgi:hypothetical protein